MDSKGYFDAEEYFRKLCDTNKLAVANGFRYCTCSGIANLEGMLQNFRTEKAFFCYDDTNDGSLVQGRNGGWFKNRTFTIFLMHRYNGSMADRAEKLSLCRELFRQLTARMLMDQEALSNEMIYLQPENILSRELGQYFLSGCTGLYFMVDMAEPVSLAYDADEWTT